MSNDITRSSAIKERIEELGTIYHHELLRPAPYEDAFKIQGDPDGPYGGFKPDWDTYAYLIASHSNGAKTLLRDRTESLLESRKWLSQTFFEQYPQYAELESVITRENTPKLYKDLEVHERARKLVLELIQLVLDSRKQTE